MPCNYGEKIYIDQLFDFFVKKIQNLFLEITNYLLILNSEQENKHFFIAHKTWKKNKKYW